MKVTPKKDKKIEIRVSEEEFKLFKIASLTVGLNTSQMVRAFIDSTLTQLRIKVQMGEIRLEDYETILNDKL